MTEAVASPAAEQTANPNALYKKILIPIDNSLLCREGINWGIEMARAWDSTLVGNHVYAARLHDDRFRQLEAGLPARFQTPEEIKKQRNIHDKLIEQGLILISDSFLDVLAKRGEQDNVKIERKLMEGIHYEQLAKDINSNDYDLVIMGAHGLGRVKVSVLGSVVGRLSRLITTDMLIVRDALTPAPLSQHPEPVEGGRGDGGEGGLRNGRILVAVDGSAYSYVALRKAIRLAKEFMCSIDVVAAFDPFYHYAAFNSIRYVLSAQAGKVFKFEEQEELHNNIIDRGLKTVCEANLMRADKVAVEEDVEISSKVLVGKPFAKILEHIAETKPTLLVMGRYGAHHVDGADMGSTSENLMRLSPISTLMVGAVEARPYDVPVLDEYEEEPLDWDPDAIKLVLRAPPFAQAMAKASVEEFARKSGLERVTLETLNTVIKGLLPPSVRHLMGLEKDVDRKISDARKFARSPIEEFSPHETIFNWSDEAKQRLNERVPTFIRPIAMLAMERYAREKGMDTVTVDVMVEVSKRLGYAQDDEDAPSQPPPLRGRGEAGEGGQSSPLPRAGEGLGVGALTTAAAATAQPTGAIAWTPEGEERLKKVPPFEREMVRKMVESMAKADGHTTITFDVADATLKKIKEFYTAQSQGASGYFAGMEGKDG